MSKKIILGIVLPAAFLLVFGLAGSGFVSAAGKATEKPAAAAGKCDCYCCEACKGGGKQCTCKDCKCCKDCPCQKTKGGGKGGK